MAYPAGNRTFIVATSTGGVNLAPPNATMDALQLPRFGDAANPGRLYSQVIYFENIGDDPIEIRTNATFNPANAGQATICHLRLAAGQRDKIVCDMFNANLDTGFGTHFFYAFSDANTPNLVVDPL